MSSLIRSYTSSGTRLAVTLRGDEPEEQLAKLKDLDLIMLLLYIPEGDEKSSRVHASRRQVLALRVLWKHVMPHFRATPAYLFKPIAFIIANLALSYMYYTADAIGSIGFVWITMKNALVWICEALHTCTHL